MKWNEIDLTSENNNLEAYASIGHGKIKLSIGACNLIKFFDRFNYVSFLKAKKDRIYYIGLKFLESKEKNSIKLSKLDSPIFGACISSKELIGTLYGKEGTSKNYTKHEVVVENDNHDVLVIYNNYSKKYYLDGDGRKPVRGRHIGTIVDKYWEVISCCGKTDSGKVSPTYLLRNTETGEEIKLSTRALFDIKKGLTSVEKIKLSREIGVDKYRGRMRAEKRKKLKPIH